MRNVRRTRWTATALFATGLPAYAQFPLNFQSDPNAVSSSANMNCLSASGTGGMMDGMSCTGGPFLQELVNRNGNQYYHVIIGDPATGFAVEYYTRALAGSTCWYGCSSARVTSGMMGGGAGVAPLSASDGAGGLNGNNTDPLGSDPNFTGNGTGRPDRTALRMVNNTDEMTQEFLKSTETSKPVITQNVDSGTLTSAFQIDMSNSDYNTMGQAGSVSLTQRITDQLIPQAQASVPDSTNFDLADWANTSHITGGRYTYQAGSGDGGSAGTYQYYEDSFDVYSVDWASYCDPAQNDHNCTFGGGGMDGGGGGGMGGM